MEKNNYVWLFAILFLAVGVSLGLGITGNVAREAYSSNVNNAPVADGGGSGGGVYLTNCELVRGQDGMNFGPTTADGIFRNYVCPVGKKPISTSATWSSNYNPATFCEISDLSQGEFYDGMAYSVATKNCSEEPGYEIEWSMVCCNGVV